MPLIYDHADEREQPPHDEEGDGEQHVAERANEIPIQPPHTLVTLCIDSTRRMLRTRFAQRGVQASKDTAALAAGE